ncbi:di-heme-cytochrome C peroxidase [uncultured Paludibaculum sp.]|uniref:di-heme-cytochrome C peroxidase n=1 Tax=uncultured Paludibaculum sp. TaxID=1765020 RepID=UPI002AAB2C7D|nr:di-heme-cytochrome C peroxidase [uncultured Paludibaculum sp.]
MKRSTTILLVGAAVVVAAIPLVRSKLADLQVQVPEVHRPVQAIVVSQNWTDQQRMQFHHAPQGTRLLPYKWFMALEQPCLSPFGCGLFHESAYLERFGFIPGKADASHNPDRLPVGFAVDKSFVDPVTKQQTVVVGLTCAACHTGEVFYDKYAVLIEGGPAMIEVTQFQKALGLALGFTLKFPLSIGRYGRFEERVLGANATGEQKKDLRAAMEAFLQGGLAEKKAADAIHAYDNPAGFGRTDALTRIGNQVFAVDTGIDKNFAVSNAAVRFPQIWDASWFNWVQYNSSIADPLVRNVGEALGVRALVKLSGPDANRFENSVNVRGLYEVEELLAGKAPFQGLNSPKWPEVFPPLDQAKVAKGGELYKRHCQGCHLPPVPELLAELNGYGKEKRAEPVHWWKNALGNWYLQVTDVPIRLIGTDPHQATDFRSRTADTGDLKLGVKSAAEGLNLVTHGIVDAYFEKEKDYFTPERRAEWAGGRDRNDPAVRDDLIYKARPLNGIWAVAPYLHNGSVPNLYLLLSPRSDRPATFWTGSKRFDPEKVGYDVSQMPGASLYDTARPGNSNSGHEFKDGPRGNGVIGPALSPDDRMAIIEYLKSL